jgi:hypothetical protein
MLRMMIITSWTAYRRSTDNGCIGENLSVASREGCGNARVFVASAFAVCAFAVLSVVVPPLSWSLHKLIKHMVDVQISSFWKSRKRSQFSSALITLIEMAAAATIVVKHEKNRHKSLRCMLSLWSFCPCFEFSICRVASV